MTRIPRIHAIVIVFSISMSVHGTVQARLADEFNDLVGYAIVASETIEEFEGCEYGKIIKFQSGLYVICDEYGYQYAYYTDAVILARAITHKGQKVLLCKMLVEDDIYDVECGQYMKIHISALLSSLGDRPKSDFRTYIEERLRLLEGIGLLESTVQ